MGRKRTHTTVRVLGLGRDGTSHGTYGFRSCLFPLGMPVSGKLVKRKTKKQNKTKKMRALRAPSFFKIFYAFVCKKVPGKITDFFFFSEQPF